MLRDCRRTEVLPEFIKSPLKRTWRAGLACAACTLAQARGIVTQSLKGIPANPQLLRMIDFSKVYLFFILLTGYLVCPVRAKVVIQAMERKPIHLRY
jgi:hypothetical protein